MWPDPTGLGLGVPGLSVLIDRTFLSSENEPDLDLIELMGMEMLVGLRNKPGEAMVVKSSSRVEDVPNKLSMIKCLYFYSKQSLVKLLWSAPWLD